MELPNSPLVNASPCPARGQRRFPLLLARLAERDKASHRTTAIIAADAADACAAPHRRDGLFAPGLRCALFPDWETLPYDTFSPHQGPDQRATGHAVAHFAR